MSRTLIVNSALAFALCCLTGTSAVAQSPLVKLNVYPTDINLATNKDRQLVVVQAVQADGITRDVSKQAAMTIANPAICRRDGTTFYPMADGQTELKVEFGGQMLTVPVMSSGLRKPRRSASNSMSCRSG